MKRTARRARANDPRTNATRSCGKWRYRVRSHAERARKDLVHRDGTPYFVYGCVDCGGFHLTSNPRYK